MTLCTDGKRLGLSAPVVTRDLITGALLLEQESVWTVRTMTVMPDHAHLLVTLGDTHPLSASIRLFKGRSSATLRSSGLRWERGCFDHRLRVEENRLPIFQYIFLNAYRTKLLPPDQRWPGYYCHPLDWAWFEPLTNESCPFPEWLV
ncbi:MAG: transposase [Opitutae bacterium]|nr:transposase [Opitutae bacterium]